MDLGIQGETALVLASTKGLGFGCAKALADNGARVVINGRNADAGAAALKGLGPNARFAQGDVCRHIDRERIFREAQGHLGNISILVTNAANPPFGRFLDFGLDDWREAFELSMLSAVGMIGLCLPGMLSHRFGRIVNIGSISVKRPEAGRPLSNSIKAALMGALVTVAREVADKGITVNNLMPGPFDTELLRSVAKALGGRDELSEEEGYARYVQSVPMRRVGTIDEFGALCAFICSRHAGYISGQSIVIDGGLLSCFM